MNNPISEKARGIIYVVSIVVSGIGVAAAPVLTAMGLTGVAPIVSTVVAGIGGTAAVLARANLSSPVVGLTEEQVRDIATKVWDRYVDHAATFPAIDSAVEVIPREPATQALEAGV